MIRVLVIDASSQERSLIAEGLEAESGIELCGVSEKPADLLAGVRKLRPDLVLLDVEAPASAGIEAIAELRRSGSSIPVIVLSGMTRDGASAALEAMARGADDFVTRPTQARHIQDPGGVFRRELCRKIRNHLRSRRSRSAGEIPSDEGRPETESKPREPVMPSSRKSASPPVTPTPGVPSAHPPARGAQGSGEAKKRSTNRIRMAAPADLPRSSLRRPEIVVVGSSTGGPDALTCFLAALPLDFPVPVVVVQHMPEKFTSMLAERLDGKCALEVREAKEGDDIRKGLVLIARGGRHLGLRKTALGHEVYQSDDPPENSCRPAVDYLFRSATSLFRERTLAVVMTGMGSDGALGAEVVRRAGGSVLVQDEESSVVWGMPGAVAELGMANEVLALCRLGPRVAELVRGGAAVRPAP